ncbi:hypothetical protein SLEP1_g44779 [Rubroshorea leprosula]|uniref:Uncharacterized protein n=1 Tax=Rubroshorea leprosula TaxID=152421 RepID=A0AAV5LHN0_9ROSI|nr:hypothetical protein SLEP1_g44779 [Rubroshorea leprosula]
MSFFSKIPAGFFPCQVQFLCLQILEAKSRTRKLQEVMS